MKSKVIMSLIVAFTVLTFSYALADENDNETNELYGPGGIKVYPIERQCAMLGGLCVHTKDCNQLTSASGLCPSKQSSGVECCYELKNHDVATTCRQQLGECMDHCHENIRRKSSDCPESQHCCVLVV